MKFWWNLLWKIIFFSNQNNKNIIFCSSLSAGITASLHLQPGCDNQSGKGSNLPSYAWNNIKYYRLWRSEAADVRWPVETRQQRCASGRTISCSSSWREIQTWSRVDVDTVSCLRIVCCSVFTSRFLFGSKGPGAAGKPDPSCLDPWYSTRSSHGFSRRCSVSSLKNTFTLTTFPQPHYNKINQ